MVGMGSWLEEEIGLESTSRTLAEGLGETLGSGLTYLMRTDVVFEKFAD